MIDKAPLQLYGAALVFCPTESPIKESFWKSRLPFLKQLAGGPSTWDPCLQTFELSELERVSALTFSGDGETIAFSTPRGIYIRDTVTGSLKLFISDERGLDDETSVLAFSHNCQYLASDTLSGVQIWDTTTGKLSFREFNPGPAWSRRSFLGFFRDDGKIIFSSDAKSFSVIDLSTRKVMQHINYPSDVLSISYSPDGSHILAILEDGSVRGWDSNMNEPQEISSFSVECHDSVFTVARFSTDLKRAAVFCFDDLTYIDSQIVDLRTGPWGTEMFSLTIESQFAISADLLKLLFLDSFGEMVAWDSSRPHALETMSYTRIAQTPDGEILATFSDTVKIWDRNLLASDSHNRETTPEFTTRPKVKISPHGLLLAATYDTGIELWDLGNARLLKVLGRDEMRFSCGPVFSPDSKLLVTNPENRLCLWDTASGELVWEVSHEFNCNALAFSLDSQRLATASYTWSRGGVKSRMLHTFDATTGQHLELPQGINEHFVILPSFSRVSFSVDLRLIQISEDDVTNIHDVTSGEKVARIKWKDSAMEEPDEDRGWHQANKTAGLVCSKTRAMAAFKHASAIYVVDTDFYTHQPWTHQFETCRIPSHLAFSEDGQYLIAGEERFSLIKPPSQKLFNFSDNWITRNGQKVLFLPPDYRLSCVAQSDHHRIVVARSGGFIILKFSEGGYDFGSLEDIENDS